VKPGGVRMVYRKLHGGQADSESGARVPLAPESEFDSKERTKRKHVSHSMHERRRLWMTAVLSVTRDEIRFIKLRLLRLVSGDYQRKLSPREDHSLGGLGLSSWPLG
jgi:hypothetical protein